GLRSESSTRYERGVNQAELPLACRRAIILLKELASGHPTGQETDSSGIEVHSPEITLRLNRINQVLGQLKRGQETAEASYLLPEEVEKILTALGCELVRDNNSDSVVWKVTVPPYRYRDLEREIDLIEEVARL
ncbi:MAG: phenylalanine--tRNA ligase subunit beta, partial [Planktothrix sp.]